MNKRQPGLDLIRILATLFVMVFHFFLYNGFYYEPQTGLPMWVANSVRWLSVSCIGLFAMLTGYLKCDEPLTKRYYRSLGPVLIGYAIASALSIPIRHFLLGDEQNLSTWITRFFSFSGVYYGWYVEMYVGLVLISPLINYAVATADHQGKLLWLAVSLVLVTGFAGVTPFPVAPDYWKAMYPLTYYLLGAVIRRKQPILRVWPVPAALSIAMLLGLATTLSTDDTLSNAYTQEFGDLFICVMTLCLFLGLYRLRCKDASKLLRWASGGCFGAYLLSHLTDATVYRQFPAWHDPEDYWKLFICATVPCFVLMLLAGKLLALVSNSHLLPGKRGDQV